MRSELTNSQRRRIRDLAATAYDRELSRELGVLEDEFGRWRRGEIDAHELKDRLHRFHKGANRRLFTIYTGDDLDIAVGAAIAKGILTEEEVGIEIVDLLRSSIDFVRENLQTEPAGKDPNASDEGAPNDRATGKLDDL